MRPWAILQTNTTLRADENNWTIRNSPALPALMSISEWSRSGLIHITLTDLINLEHEYPGALKDIDTLNWQVMLVKDQMKDTRNG